MARIVSGSICSNPDRGASLGSVGDPGDHRGAPLTKLPKLDMFIGCGSSGSEVRSELEFDEVGGKRGMRRSVATDGGKNSSVSRNEDLPDDHVPAGQVRENE